MIDTRYALTMARYNAWQNRQLKGIFEDKGEAWLRKTGAAHFGSIFATANHILWADALWMGRLTGTETPEQGVADSVRFTDSLADWAIARFRMDARIVKWAETLRTTALHGDLTWHSLVEDAQMTRPRAFLVAHMFNHQTHHRGQIHAMLTAAGAEAPVSDLVFMPEAGPWL